MVLHVDDGRIVGVSLRLQIEATGWRLRHANLVSPVATRQQPRKGNNVHLMTPDDFRDWRRRLGWTQADAATKLGLTVRAIKHYEGGTRGISPVIEKLTHAIGRRGSGAFWKSASGRLAGC
jgi:DNA-binding XRE family transcriptional regulator